MPYIKPERRSEIVDDNGLIDPLEIRTAGELNFAITMLVDDFVQYPSYDNFNAAIGALECAKLELYRRRIANYEDIKMRENGDVYTWP